MRIQSIALAVALTLGLAGCATKTIDRPVIEVKYVVIGPNEINLRATPVPAAVSDGCSEKGFNARACLASRTTTAATLYTQLGQCNSDKVEIRKTLLKLREQHE